jgi:hypothetical protein
MAAALLLIIQVKLNLSTKPLFSQALLAAHLYMVPCFCNCTFAIPEYYQMNEINEQLRELFDRIPRRHTADNVKEMYGILDAYEDLLKTLEADDRYEKQIASFFEALDPIRATIKKSNDNKASKKTKDVLFDEASGALKDSMEEAMQLKADGGA